ncbi:class I SAM-dependent methyltransferase [Candidatus Kaiserbacteria bacterium]|nr:class I SAM-dependent methyltransferase [Candidatus Kaiserbacteria bacterium]
MTESECRSCKEKGLLPILSLGHMPLANALQTGADLEREGEMYPLDLVFCPACTLVQITETVPPEKLFRDYLYFSSFSDTILESARSLTTRVIEGRHLTNESLVVEIASNDGYLLKNYLARGIPCLGIEPAQNIANTATERGVPTIAEFFNEELATRLAAEGKHADVIHANNVIAHVADLHGAVAGIAKLLKPDGVAIIENHYVKDLIDHTEFDSIYHEHLCYYSATSFQNLFKQHGLVLSDVERIPLHGGSLRAYFQKDSSAHETDGAHAFLAAEQAWGVGDYSFYRDFGTNVDHLRSELTSLLRKIKGEGGTIAVYGASAKSTTLLNYFGIGNETIEYVVDRSSAKQGLFTPGTHLPIYAPEKLLETQPSHTLLLSWNFEKEILAQQQEYRVRGGRFIIPIPEVRML